MKGAIGCHKSQILLSLTELRTTQGGSQLELWCKAEHWRICVKLAIDWLCQSPLSHLEMGKIPAPFSNAEQVTCCLNKLGKRSRGSILAYWSVLSF